MRDLVDAGLDGSMWSEDDISEMWSEDDISETRDVESSGALLDKLGTQVVVPLPSLQERPNHDAIIKDASCCICMCDFEPGESARVSHDSLGNAFTWADAL